MAEIMQEMTEAGAQAIFGNRDIIDAWDLANVVYKAMERTRLGQLVRRAFLF